VSLFYAFHSNAGPLDIGFVPYYGPQILADIRFCFDSNFQTDPGSK
jgi:hypothetical protein